MAKQMKTPELDKLAKVYEQSQAAGAFLDWMLSRGYVQHTRTRFRMEEVLADYFCIDLGKVENERRQILESLRVESKK